MQVRVTHKTWSDWSAWQRNFPSLFAVSGGWVWGEHGFLRNLGVVDFAGAGPIHVVGGAAALTAAIFIGPRIGRYDKGTKSLPMGNPMSACMGLFILWWGWIGFNAGSSYGITGGKWEIAAKAGVGTTLATMGAGAFSILFSMWKNKGKKVDVFEVVSGILASLGERVFRNVFKQKSSQN